MVFVSSTFRDMLDERDVLTKHVFPELRRICEQRGVAWGDVDLRWGVTSEQAADGDVLPVCLRAVDRCRPFFLGLLGERYGWIPDEIPADLIESQPWLADAKGRSVTDLEIQHGVLRDPGAAHHAFFYFRDPDHAARDSSAAVSDNPAMASDLKERIRKSGVPVRECFMDPQELGRWVRDDLVSVIDQLYPPDTDEDPLEAETRQHEAHAADRADIYIERASHFRALDTFVDSPDGDALVVLGESGSGKSALLASWTHRRRSRVGNELVLPHFVGSTLQSTEEDVMLRRLNRELASWSGVSEASGITDNEALRREFARLLGAAHFTGPVILVLDGLNQLDDRSAAQELGWLPLELPRGVKLITSTLPGAALDALDRRGWLTRALRVEPLQTDERAQLVETYLERYAKRLEPEAVAHITSHQLAHNALFLRTVLDELRLWGRHETLLDHIRHLLGATSVDELFDLILHRYERDYERDRPALVGEAMSLIAAARSGLTTSELLDLLGDRASDPLPQATWMPLYHACGELLIERNGVIDFAHDFVRRAVARRYLSSPVDRNRAHRRLATYMRARGPVPRALVEAPWQFAEARAWEDLTTLLSDRSWFVALSRDHPLELRRLWTLIHHETEVRAEQSYRAVAATAMDADSAEFNLAVSDLFFDLGARAAAESFVGAVHTWAQHAGETAYRQAATLALGHIAAERGDLDEGLRLYSEHERLCTANDDRHGLATSYGSQAAIFVQRGLFEDGRELLRRQHELCISLGNQIGLAGCLGQRAHLERAQGELGYAEELFAEQERIYRSMGHADGIRVALGGRATILTDRGVFDRALALYEDQERIAREVGSRPGTAEALTGQTRVHIELGAIDQASRCNREAHRLYDGDGDPIGVQGCLGNQGLILCDAGEYGAAMEMFLGQERICRRLQLPDDLQRCLGNQAIVHMATGDLDAATELLLEQERLCRTLGVAEGLALSLVNQAAILSERGAGQAGARRHRQALAIAGAAGLTALVARIGADGAAAGIDAAVRLDTAATVARSRRPAAAEERAFPSTSAVRRELLSAKLRRPLALVIPVVLGIGAIVGGAAIAEAIALAAAAAVLVLSTWWTAASRDARRTFYESYAAARGLEHTGRAALPDGTPLLRAGDSRWADHVMTGTLPQGLRGAVALHTYRSSDRGDRGSRRSVHRSTVVVFRIPEAADRVRDLYCQPRTRRGSLMSTYGLLGMKPLSLESGVAGARYEIVRAATDDPNWLRQLFSPTFVLWLAEESPAQFAFQLSRGLLCAYVPGHLANADSLDQLVEAAEVVGMRVISEARE